MILHFHFFLLKHKNEIPLKNNTTISEYMKIKNNMKHCCNEWKCFQSHLSCEIFENENGISMQRLYTQCITEECLLIETIGRLSHIVQICFIFEKCTSIVHYFMMVYVIRFRNVIKILQKLYCIAVCMLYELNNYEEFMTIQADIRFFLSSQNLSIFNFFASFSKESF